MSGPDGAGGDVIFEIQRIGEYQRVAAVHVATGVEVVVQAPANAAFADVRALALKKLERALAGPKSPPDRPSGGGTIV